MNKFLAVVFLIHVVLCILFSTLLFPIVQEKFNVSELQDEYDDLGKSLAEGRGFVAAHGEESVIRGPGYPLFISIFYRFFGFSHLVIFIAQAFVSGLNVVLGAWLVRLLHSRRSAKLAGILLMINPFLIWYTSRIMVETLFMTACLLIFIASWYLVRQRTTTFAILTGIAIAAGAYIKSIVLVFPIAVFLLLLFTATRFLENMKLVLVTVLAMAVLILPWTIRNYNVTDGEIIPVHASLALPLTQSYLYMEYLAESPLSARSAYLATNDKLNEVTAAAGYEPFHYPLDSLQSELRIEKAAKKYFFDLYASDPVMYIGHSLLRLLMFWYYSTNPLFSIFWLVANGLLLVLMILGLFSVDARHGIFAITWIVFIWILHASLIAHPRYAAPLHPLMLSAAIPFLLFQMPWLKRLPGLRHETHNQHLMPRDD